MNILKTLLLGTACAVAILSARPAAADEDDRDAPYRHVLLISVDGLHAGDVAKYLADPAHADSALTLLANHGTTFTRAFATAPSDSFPGLLALVTGGTPRSTGVYYDDSYDRTMFAPGSNCVGAPGAEMVYNETIDADPNRLTVAAGGILGNSRSQIDAARLPMSNASGTCVPVYPHSFVKVNTIFEVIRRAGLRTAWADKHPAYDIVNGPSGAGVDDLFTPEVDSVIPGTTPSDATSTTTNSYRAIQGNDELKVQAILHEIAGLNSLGTAHVGVPAILGMNFQSVSVGQKLAMSGPTDPAGYTGGYVDADYTPGNALTAQLAYVDDALGRMIAALGSNGLINDTLVIVTAKHGQSPVNVKKRKAVSDAPYANTPGIAQYTTDDVGLVWLTPQTRGANIEAAQDYLTSLATRGALHIDALLTPEIITQFYRNPAHDARAPDFFAITTPGVIYTGGTKLAEHGGFAFQDRNVGMIVAAANLPKRTNDDVAATTQVAPTILRALGLNPSELKAVRIEGTRALKLRERSDD